MKYTIYQVDAFAEKLFEGNPAAVIPLKEWLSDELMLKIAAENNLAETAFFVPKGNDFEIRWCTPTVEVDLCGHATLASAHVLFEHLNYDKEKIVFHSRSGELKIRKREDNYIMNFPSDKMEVAQNRADIKAALGQEPLAIFRGSDDFMAVFENEESIQNLNPDFVQTALLPSRGLIATAPGNEVDFVSRFFAPQSGVDEDPVTGSAHTLLTPYWAQQLNKNQMRALQLSQRKGKVNCHFLGDRVELSGTAITYLVGEIFLK